MFNKFVAGLFPAVMVLSCLAGASVQTALDQPAAASSEQESTPAVDQATTPEQSYIGSDQCFSCHREQTSTWSNTKHAKGFEILPDQYREDTSCLKCHLTGFGEPGGYAPGMTAEEALPFQNVGCESCHGPGAAHQEAVKRWTLAEPSEEEKLLEEIKTTILRIPTDSQCATCHQTQVHQSHPHYEGKPEPASPADTTAATILASSPHSYSVKTCGSCHYEQYKNWRVETHASLSNRLSAKYMKDENCLKCHSVTNGSSDWYTTTTDSQANNNNPVGVGCESCHGSALKHVLFNKQNISGLRLEPETVQAARDLIRKEKPASACLQCHIREGHQEHVEFERPQGEQAK